MKKNRLFIALLAISCALSAQPGKQLSINKLQAEHSINVDGIIEESEWALIDSQKINMPLGDEGKGFDDIKDYSAYWKAAWNESGLYILFEVTADDSHYDITGAYWTGDISEIYLDMNVGNLKDGNGASVGGGHYQVSGLAVDSTIYLYGSSQKTTKNNTAKHTFVQEIFLDWTDLLNVDGEAFTPDPSNANQIIGFDVYGIDNDGPENAVDGSEKFRMAWSNDKSGETAEENWNKMDDAGRVTFSNIIPTIVTNIANNKNPIAYISNRNLMIANSNGLVSMFDITGKEVLKAQVNNQVTISLNSFKTGLYVIRLNNNTYSKKLILN